MAVTCVFPDAGKHFLRIFKFMEYMGIIKLLLANKSRNESERKKITEIIRSRV